MAQVTITIPEDLLRRLQAAAERRAATLDDTIVAALDAAVEPTPSAPLTKDEELRRLRAALGRHAVTTPPDAFKRRTRRALTPEERMEILKSIPVLDPPLSQTIIEDREDRL